MIDQACLNFIAFSCIYWVFKDVYVHGGDGWRGCGLIVFDFSAGVGTEVDLLGAHGAWPDCSETVKVLSRGRQVPLGMGVCTQLCQRSGFGVG